MLEDQAGGQLFFCFLCLLFICSDKFPACSVKMLKRENGPASELVSLRMCENQ